MRFPVITVGPGVTLEEAYRLLLEKGIRHLPGSCKDLCVRVRV